ncbi:MAG TPA: hypothetical protein PLU30_27445 [Verrucomicrobiae bacterium]|nr:hypothetical protein [Verrucomicrobiae bacterium]
MNGAPKPRFPILLPTLLGGIAGTLNGLMLFIEHIDDTGFGAVNFPWSIIPCGTFHGAVLAAFAVVAANLLVGRPRRPAVAPLVIGYLAGGISFIPTGIFFYEWPIPIALTWPMTFGRFATNPLPDCLQPVIGPFQVFGLVTLILSAALLWTPRRLWASLPFPLCAAIVAGVLGSLCFWITYPGFATHLFVDGTVWGLLVGLGLRWGQQRSPAHAPTPHA